MGSAPRNCVLPSPFFGRGLLATVDWFPGSCVNRTVGRIPLAIEKSSSDSVGCIFLYLDNNLHVSRFPVIVVVLEEESIME